MISARTTQKTDFSGAKYCAVSGLAVGVPFTTTEEAWFWFMAAREAQIEGVLQMRGIGRVPRPCEPVDILNVLDRLYRGRILLRDHLLVLRHYGQRFLAPDPARPREARAATIWGEAMEKLKSPLIRRGIVADMFDTPREVVTHV